MGIASDLVCYASLNMPVDDVSTSGGAINPDVRVVFTQIATDEAVEVLSSNAADTTQQITVRGRKPDNTVSEQTVTLNGTTVVPLTTLGTLDRVVRANMNADAAGVVTVRTALDIVIGTIPIGERGFFMIHREGQASASAQKDFYYKVFWKNTHGTDALNAAVVRLAADPANRATFALAASKGDSGSVANRLTAPALTFDDTDKAVPTGALAAGEQIGVWIKFSHPAGEPAQASTIDLTIGGTFP